MENCNGTVAGRRGRRRNRIFHVENCVPFFYVLFSLSTVGVHESRSCHLYYFCKNEFPFFRFIRFATVLLFLFFLLSSVNERKRVFITYVFTLEKNRIFHSFVIFFGEYIVFDGVIFFFSFDFPYNTYVLDCKISFCPEGENFLFFTLL